MKKGAERPLSFLGVQEMEEVQESANPSEESNQDQQPTNHDSPSRESVLIGRMGKQQPSPLLHRWHYSAACAIG